MPGRVTWIREGKTYRDVLTHELGHNLGLDHANSLICRMGKQRITQGPQVLGPGVRRPVGRHGHQQPPVLRRRAAAARAGPARSSTDDHAPGPGRLRGRRGLRLWGPGPPREGVEARVVLVGVPHHRRGEREAAGHLRGEGHARSADQVGHGPQVAPDPGCCARQPGRLAVLPRPGPGQRHLARLAAASPRRKGYASPCCRRTRTGQPSRSSATRRPRRRTRRRSRPRTSAREGSGTT